MGILCLCTASENCGFSRSTSAASACASAANSTPNYLGQPCTEVVENILNGNLVHAGESLLPKFRLILGGQGVQLNVPT